MKTEELINDLESNQSQECEEAKKRLVDLINQTKDISLVHRMIDHFFGTGSLRILEVLAKVHSPHYIYILDKLSDWLKDSRHRSQALYLLSFVVGKRPSWLYKIGKHKLIWDVLKLPKAKTEKELIPLMSSLLCVVMLLPIMPLNVSIYLTQLFKLFGFLATWKSQHSKNLSGSELTYLQLGLQILFNRLYMTYPWKFLLYLRDFEKEKSAIFQQTIKPLLDRVRVHPMVDRRRTRELGDGVQECAKL